MVHGFAGFPAKANSTQIPNPFFSELLPQIDDLYELKVTLYCFWGVQQREGEYRYVTRRDMRSDTLLMAMFGKTPESAEAGLTKAIERAIARGTLLHVIVEGEDIYFMNTARGRGAIEALEHGDWTPGKNGQIIGLIVERPNIFTLYEQNIGALTPILGDTLRDAEATYPAEWIVEAMTIAVENNKRNWRYVEAIMKRWATEGKISSRTAKELPADTNPYSSDEHYQRYSDE